ncbi:hypothetical protein IP78_05665 [Brevundimonas sp. AAP58]|uniref:YciI family protein n=1 Tax=Brevundimonas sp. AAP58 TaxID=1523422 RepID=UPI0006B8ACEA|nr:YciI family protein [Brevundimonas sp. AAP58]KPF81130.1 hypothetical protein IP78_05665 [Brevundimonas sp. AAP58]
MPHFLILAEDRAEAGDDRLAHRQEHIEYWNSKPGVVKVAGAILDGDRARGSALLVEAQDEARARQMLAEDPFARHGVFQAEVTVMAVRPAIGDWLPTE